VSGAMCSIMCIQIKTWVAKTLSHQLNTGYAYLPFMVRLRTVNPRITAKVSELLPFESGLNRDQVTNSEKSSRPTKRRLTRHDGPDWLSGAS
jgi:hypothetical protein